MFTRVHPFLVKGGGVFLFGWYLHVIQSEAKNLGDIHIDVFV